ncbi:hypothetical protein [Oerskovia enterophila]|uniref:Uncharacterized protein n=1 Tax=Oerskovia enterophila TaxID=43678 RepID=A0ABX2Y9G0_9CELL|nr:hypothetical protein [Oerskovia enterophila]OCI32903.1 hypothetical protein OERS_04950 [Oerskovia enterophila]
MTSSSQIPPRALALHQHRIEAFVVRARRVEAHSLARDRGKLNEFSRGGLKVVSDGATLALVRSFPDEETMESAAARVRPILLSDEDCYLPSVLKSIKAFGRDDDKVKDQSKEALARWQSRTSSTDPNRPVGVQVLVHDTKTGQSGSMNELQLALAWIYGDVVHHDSGVRAGAAIFGLRERFFAAAPLITYVMYETLLTLDWIRVMNGAGLIELPASVLEDEVALETTEVRLEATAYVAEIGTSIPTDATSELGPEWQDASALFAPKTPDPTEPEEPPHTS